MRTSLARLALAATAVAVHFGATAFANTYVVDSHGGAGVDFTDLPPAIAAVQPGDVLLVRSGSYSSFTCGQGISILGYGAASVSGAATISSVPQGQIAVVTGLAPTSLVVASCGGRVVVQNVSGLSTVLVAGSTDVRLLDVNPDAAFSGQIGFTVVTSRVEVVQSTIHGGTVTGTCHQAGGAGLRIETAGRVHFARSSSYGGSGPQACYDPNPNGGDTANGGPAISIVDSELFVAGAGSQNFLQGGSGGFNIYYSNCYYDGDGDVGIAAANAAVAWSGLRVLGGWTCVSGSINDPNCYCYHAAPFSGATITQASPADSTLGLNGTPTAGQSVSLTLTGEPGSDAVVWLGRHLVLTPEAGVDIELAVDRQRVVNLGTMPPGGSITVHLNIPSSYLPGTRYALQGECRLASGVILRSNSIPIVVR